MDRPRLVAAVSAAISVALALMCTGLTMAWTREHRRLECYHDQAEKGLVADRKCER